MTRQNDPEISRSFRKESLLSGFLERIAALEERGDAREESFYPAFVDLLSGWARGSGFPDVQVTAIPRRTQGCSLDFQVWRGPRLVGYVEAKRPSADLDAAAESAQLRRYRETFPNLILTSFRELRLYRNGEDVTRATLGTARDSGPELSTLLGSFFAFGGPRRLGAAALARNLASRARVLEGRIEALLERDKGSEEPSELTVFYRALASHFFHALTERQFADLYAQTVVYGMLAARCWEDGDLDRRSLYERIPPASGILRDIFRYVCLSPPPEIEWIVDDLVDLLRPADLKRALQRQFLQRGDRDPILHFYETFLRHYDAELRTRRGVYYTPPAVVSYVVRSVDALLRTRLGRRSGLADRSVWFLDPAAGTMTFVIEAFRCAIESCSKELGRGAVPSLIQDHLLPHGFGFELMMAPYAIGHLKVSLFLAEQGYPLRADDRVNLLLTNALEREDLSQATLPGLPSLAREVRKAAEVKEDRRICVVIGNPPYSGRSANRTKEADRMLRESHAPGDEGYYRVDGRALGEKNAKWLQDDYVKFLRFAQRKIDECGEGVVGLVLSHSFLDNPTFLGLRRSLMTSFDEIYLLDLHGNRRKKEVSPDGAADENVFDEVGQGVSILLLVKKAGARASQYLAGHPAGHPTRIARHDLWGNRLKKLRWLAARNVDSTPWVELQPREPSYLFVARDARLEEIYSLGVSLPEIFPLHSPGVLTARDAFVMDVDGKALEKRMWRFRSGLASADPPDPKDTGTWSRSEAVRRAASDDGWASRFTKILVRPFDVRHIFYADYLVERPRERGMRHLRGGSNLALVVPRMSKDGPGALVTDRIAAHKAVSAYDINSVFPLYLLPEEGRLSSGAGGAGPLPNVAPKLHVALEQSLGGPVTPEALFGYVYAVLYSDVYRRRYAAFLAAGFPRIPFPRTLRLFETLSGLGAELVDLHLLRTPVESPVRSQGSGGAPLSKTVGRGYRPDERRLDLNGQGDWIEGIAPRVWDYRIGGYQVLPRWLQARAGRRLTYDENQSFPRIVAVLARTIEIQRRIDGLIPELDLETES